MPAPMLNPMYTKASPVLYPDDLQGQTPDSAGGEIPNMQTQQPPEGGQGPDVNAMDVNIKAQYQKLNEILMQNYPEINFEEKYKGLINDVQNRPEEKPPNALLSAAYMMGAPGNAPGILQRRIDKIDEAHSQKEADLLKLKEGVLQSSIQQEVQKGNFKLALKQSEQLAEIQRTNADRDRAAGMKDWKEKQSIKTADAKTIIARRVQAIADNFHLDEKMKLALVNQGMGLVRSMLGKTNLLGEGVYDYETIQDTVDRILPQLYEYAKEASTPGEKNTDKPTTPNPAAPPETPLQKAFRESREAEAKAPATPAK